MYELNEKYRNNTRGEVTKQDVQFSFRNRPEGLIEIDKDALKYKEESVINIRIKTSFGNKL